MEKKFESELGKRIVEGKKRGSSKKTILGIAAVCASVLLFGAASVTFAVGVNAPVVITEKLLFEQVEDLILNEDLMDTDLKRSMSLKYRSTLPPGNGDTGNTKLIYSLNMQVKTVDGYDFVGMIVGDLSVLFAVDVEAKITIACTVTNAAGILPAETEQYTSTGVSVDASASVPAELIVGSEAVTDEFGTVTEVPVFDAYTVAIDDTISWTITVDISVPNLSGSLTEVAWPGIYEDIANTASF
jgi:hypothetical protein